MIPFILSFAKENVGDILVCAFILFFCLGGWLTFIGMRLKELAPARKGFEVLAERVNGMSNRINDIWGLLTDRSPVSSNSPLSLNTLGKEISDKINAKQIAEKYFKKMLAAVEGTEILNAFEIQTISMDFAKSKLLPLLSKDEKNQVEEEAFQRGMILPGILDVIGIELRDIWLKNKGLDVSQVDNKDGQ